MESRGKKEEEKGERKEGGRKKGGGGWRKKKGDEPPKGKSWIRHCLQCESSDERQQHQVLGRTVVTEIYDDRRLWSSPWHVGKNTPE